MKKISYQAVIEKNDGRSGWHFVCLPDDARSELVSQSDKNGNVPVVVTIGKTSWSSTTMSMGEQRWFVAVKADVRMKESLKVGDSVIVHIMSDGERLTHKGGEK